MLRLKSGIELIANIHRCTQLNLRCQCADGYIQKQDLFSAVELSSRGLLSSSGNSCFVVHKLNWQFHAENCDKLDTLESYFVTLKVLTIGLLTS